MNYVLDNGRVAVRLPASEASEFAADALMTRPDPPDGLIMVLPAELRIFRRLSTHGVYIPEAWTLEDYEPPLIEGRFAPMPHQLETAAFLAVNPRAYCTSEMRTGKTGAVVMALDFLWRRSLIRSALIVCPASVMKGVWKTAIETTLPGAECGLLRGSAAQRREVLAKGHPFNVINYEGLEVIMGDLEAKIALGEIDAVVIDELSHYGKATTARWRTAYQLFNSGNRKVDVLWGLTGTPGADSLAVYGMCRLVNPKKVPCRSKGAWQALVQVRYGPEVYHWRDRSDAAETIGNTMQPNIRFTTDDVLRSLPPVVFERRTSAMTEAQRKAYRALAVELQAELADGALIEARQKAAYVSKVFQIAAGAVITDQGAVEIDSEPRDELLSRLVQASPAKSVVFCSYVAAGDKLTRHLNSVGASAVRVDGSVTGATRDRIFSDFQNTSKYKVLVAHPITTAYGTELAAADQLIFDGPMMSGTHTYLQGLHRLSSAKQTADAIKVIEVCSTADEAKFFDSLRNRGDRAQAIGQVFSNLKEGKTCLH